MSPIGSGESGDGDFGTRKLWALVAKGIREGDFETRSHGLRSVPSVACFAT